VGQRFLIDGPQKHLWKIRVKAADLGTDDWTQLRLTMDQSFVPKDLQPPLNGDERELALGVYQLSVADAALAGSREGVTDAVALGPAAPSPRAPVKSPRLAAGLSAPADATGAPANDAFAAPIVMRGIPWSTAGTNRGATLEAGEPNHDGATPGASVWWRWTAPRSGMVRLTTQGSDFDTVLGVYVGESLAGLKAVASNDDDYGRQSASYFFATAGTTYSIAVAGYHAWTGHLLLSLDSLDAERHPGPWRE
jgi:hypothetical protein